MKALINQSALAGLLSALVAQTCVAGGEEVVVLYNARVPESKPIALEYATKRHVPEEQVFGFDLPTGEEISRAEFRDKFQKQFAQKLEATKLWRIGTLETKDADGKPVKLEGRVVHSKIRYAALSYGIPLRILRDGSLKEPEEEKMRPEFRRNEAAVDSELACLPMFNSKQPLAGPLHNPVYSITNAAWIHPTNGVLIVARLDGPTPAIARALVDKALQAEADGLWGRGYFDLRNVSEPGLKQGDDWISGAAEISKHLGLETIVDQSGWTFPASFPMSHIAFYAGWYTENVSGAFTLPKIEFMPGAFAYHLHSFSASSMRNTQRSWVAPLLEKGVTCTMGTVDEPYLGGTPDIAAFAGRWLFYGMTFGEAACASQSVLSWQTTVVGDPLYRPSGKPPKQQHQELEARQSKLIEWSHLRVVNLNLVRGGTVAESVTYLEDISNTRHSAVLEEKLGDLYSAQGKPSSAVLSYELALKLEPSPQQRIRLRLTLGDKLIALERNEEAFANFQRFLEENPNYPDKLPIYRKLLPLAQKLGKKEEAAKFEALINPAVPTPK